jgi:hypothetical protein
MSASVARRIVRIAVYVCGGSNMEYEKKYNALVGQIKKAYLNAQTDSTKAVLEDILPSLKESEDERIRKEIMDFIDTKTIDSDERRNRWFSYLEKHKPFSFTSLEDTKMKMSLIQYISELNQDVVHLHPGIETCNEWIAWLEKQGEQKPQGKTALEAVNEEKVDNQNCVKHADKVEPKFHEGEWVILTAGELSTTLQIVKVDTNKRLYWFNDSSYLPIVDEECLHLWTIQDAKDGDVLVDKYGNIGIYQGDKNAVVWNSYCYCGVNKVFYDEGSHEFPCYPATKVQRDTLIKAMTDAGYTFDFEKKKLKKIEEEFNGEDYGIDSLWHAQNILERTLGKVDGYQSDDGILEHKCAITAVKKLYEKKPAEWSEEDETNLTNTIIMLKEGASQHFTNSSIVPCVDWLKSLKERMKGV